MLHVFHKGKLHASVNDISTICIPNKALIYSEKRNQWYNRVVGRWGTLPSYEVPAEYRAMVLLLT